MKRTITGLQLFGQKPKRSDPQYLEFSIPYGTWPFEYASWFIQECKATAKMANNDYEKNQVILNSELAVAVVMLVLVSNIAVSGDYICVDCGTLRLVCI